MAVFTYIAATATAFLVNAGFTAAAAAAIVSTASNALFTLGAALLNKPKVSKQEMMATLSQTDAARIRAYGRNLMGGQRVFYEAKDGGLYQIVVLHHGAVDGIIAFWWDGEKLPYSADGFVARYKRNYFNDGTGNGGDFGFTEHDPQTKFPDLWTAQHRLEKQATMLLFFGDPSAEDFAKVFPKGAQTQVQAEIRGVKVRNLAGDMVYATSSALCIRDFMTHPDGWNIPLSKLDADAWADFTALCGEQVPLATGGTENRYRLSGYYSLNDPLKDSTARMLATCDGQIYETPEGKIGILGGEWTEPDVTITGQDILSIEMRDGYDPFTDYNILKPAFVSKDHGYQSTEIDEIRDEAALVDQPERLEIFDVDMCVSHTQLQRLAKIRFAKDKREYEGTITTNLVGLKARFPQGRGIHTIRIQAEEFGLDDVFEVTGHTFDLTTKQCRIGIASLANPYGWTTAEEKPMPASLDDLGKPVSVQTPPANALVTQEVVDVSGGVNGVKLQVVVDAPATDGLDFRAQVAPGTVAADDEDAAWIDMSASRRRAETGVLDDLGTYTVRVKWRGRSDWIIAGTVKVVANPNKPDAPTQFGAVATGTNVYLDWKNPSMGFYRTQIYRNTANDFSSAIPVASVGGNAGQFANHTDELATNATGQRYYWAVTVNGSGVPSDPAGPQAVTI